MRLFLFLIFLIFLSSCNNGNKPDKKALIRPDTLLSEQKMIRIITEVHLTEAALVYLRNHGTDVKSLTTEYYNVLFSKFKTSKRNFKQNLEYYQQDPEHFMLMYDEVIKRLEILSTVKGMKRPNREE